MPGVAFKTYLEVTGYSKSRFMGAIENLAHDFARLHQIQFQSFGAVLDGGKIEPENKLNFADYFTSILERRFARCVHKGVFSKNEIKPTEQVMNSQLEAFRGTFHYRLTLPRSSLRICMQKIFLSTKMARLQAILISSPH